MTTDEQNNNISGNPSDETQPQPTVGPLEEVAGAQSRRKFLRLAVISGATVATVGATTGVALAAHPHTGILTNLGLAGQSTQSGSCGTMCFESSGYETVCLPDPDHHGKCLPNTEDTFSYNSGNGQTNPGTFYFFFQVPNLPPGSYTASISPDLAVAPFSYQGSNSVKLYQFPVNTAFSCPVPLPPKSVTPNETSNNFPISTTISGSNADIWVAVHFVFNGTGLTGNLDYTFTITLKSGATVKCALSKTIHAVQK